MKIKVVDGISLVDLLLKEFGSSSKSNIRKLIGNGTVSVNGKIVTIPSFKVKPGDEVEYQKYKGKNLPDPPFPVLFEDDHIVVIVKPAGMLTYGERGTEGTSVYKEMLDYVKIITRNAGHIYVVHRLDRDVSGVLIFAKTEKIKEVIKDQWKENVKRYYALVEGFPEKEEGTVRSWLMENKDLKVYSTVESPEAKLAITHYKVVRKFQFRSLVDIRIETGRKHQIRVHMADLGCPIVGDRKYGTADKKSNEIRLHAYYFALKHPVTGQVMEFRAELPAGFVNG